jgi:hypothetical protein
MGRLCALSNDTTVTGRLSLVTQIRNLADIQNTTFFSLSELTEIVNQELPEVHEGLVRAYSSRYFFKQQTFSLIGGQQDYPLSTDYGWLFRVEVQLQLSDGFHWVDVLRYDEAQENVINNYPIGFPTVLRTPLRYNLRGTDPAQTGTPGSQNIHFVPYPYIGGQSIRVSYAPYCPVLINPSDVYDFIDGWESIVRYGGAAAVNMKQNLDPSTWLGLKQQQLERLSAMAERDVTMSEQVHDVEAERYGSSGSAL